MKEDKGHQIERAVAQALFEGLDVVEARPYIMDLPVEKLEPEVELFVLEMQEHFALALRSSVDDITKIPPSELVGLFLRSGINLPYPMLLKVSKMINRELQRENIFIKTYEMEMTPAGGGLFTAKQKNLWYCKMRIDLGLEEQTVYQTTPLSNSKAKKKTL